jgi:anti-sigma B factor antagonist
MDDDALVVQVRHRPSYTVITVAGEVDIATAPQLGHHLAALAGSGRPVIADLDQVSFIDAAGLRVLAAAARQAAAAGGSLHVVSGRYQVRRVFALTGLDRQIPLARTLAGALAGLPADPDTGRARNNPAAALHGLLRDLVLAARDLAGPSWLAAASDDPDIAAFTALQAAPAPPSPAGLDEIISRVLWARFPPPGTPRDGGPPPAGPPAR